VIGATRNRPREFRQEFEKVWNANIPRMGHALPASVREILAGRAGEEMELSDRYLNPQLGRIVRTLGYDREIGRAHV